MSITWEELETESHIFSAGEYVIPESQYRNQGYEEEELIDYAYDLLYPNDYYKYSLEVGTIVYHGGISLEEAKQRDHYVFFVSTDLEAAANYGKLTAYRVVKNYPYYHILYDQLAANYGWDVDISQFESVKEFDDYMSFTGEEVKEAEYKAHMLLSTKSSLDQKPLVIGSWQDSEFGFFPTAHDALEEVKVVDYDFEVNGLVFSYQIDWSMESEEMKEIVVLGFHPRDEIKSEAFKSIESALKKASSFLTKSQLSALEKDGLVQFDGEKAKITAVLMKIKLRI